MPWQPSVCLSAKMATKFQNFMNDDVRALKHALENLDTGKSTFRRILMGILSRHSENSELKPNLSPKLLRARSSLLL